GGKDIRHAHKKRGKIMRVGFIGLGRMGSGMATNLVKAGHEVIVYNRTPGKVQALVEHGARVAVQVADACRGDAVIAMLANDTAVESVVFGAQGIISSLGNGAIHVSMSTISVALGKGWPRRTQTRASVSSLRLSLGGRKRRPRLSYSS